MGKSISLKQFSTIYGLLTLVFLSSVIFELQWLHYLTKPMFMVLLMVFHYISLDDNVSKFSRLIQLGLFFSWLGDIALMFDDKIELFFIIGLGSFLIAHLGYAAAFIGNIRSSPQSLKMGRSVALALPFILFTGTFFVFMKDGLPADLFIPVLAYTVVISVMGIFAALRYGHVAKRTFNWILIGAILFILSDCIIAINKFVVDFENDAVVNMILYLSGQFMITVGALYQIKPKAV